MRLLAKQGQEMSDRDAPSFNIQDNAREKEMKKSREDLQNCVQKFSRYPQTDLPTYLSTDTHTHTH